ncbi:uncharacterized protein CLUP02_16005 [Colletotrichum lupini]|uniref:Uncharacterized protein n=1 Tax=Colletotrichum lupini TaxID=145971 RepID=A0A9Q8T7Z0_9PEZI|nr:uncharacterized protein CLUP02_16005 [Colletotrichum lupini]UQC90475.1 hypothetical protein CLUP02_16005 [Colletotrichum lupini]
MPALRCWSPEFTRKETPRQNNFRDRGFQISQLRIIPVVGYAWRQARWRLRRAYPWPDNKADLQTGLGGNVIFNSNYTATPQPLRIANAYDLGSERPYELLLHDINCILWDEVFFDIRLAPEFRRSNKGKGRFLAKTEDQAFKAESLERKSTSARNLSPASGGAVNPASPLGIPNQAFSPGLPNVKAPPSSHNDKVKQSTDN